MYNVMLGIFGSRNWEFEKMRVEALSVVSSSALARSLGRSLVLISTVAVAQSVRPSVCERVWVKLAEAR